MMEKQLSNNPMTDQNNRSVLLMKENSLVLSRISGEHSTFLRQGAHGNTGAERALISLNETKAYCYSASIPLRP